MSLTLLRFGIALIIGLTMILFVRAPVTKQSLAPLPAPAPKIAVDSIPTDIRSSADIRKYIQNQLVQEFPNDDYRQRMRSNLAAELNNRGWDFIQLNSPDEALPFLNASHEIQVRPENLHGLGLVHFLKGQKKKAISFFLAIDPKDRDVEVWKILIRHGANESNDVLQLAETAHSFFPEDQSLNLLRAKIIQDQKDRTQWISSKVDGVTLLYPHQTSIELRNLHEQLFHSIFVRLKWNWPMEELPPTRVYFTPQLANQSGIEGLAQGHAIQAPLLTSQTQDQQRHLKKVLAHELAHVLLDAIASRSLPEWIHEGLARWTEGAWIDFEQMKALYRKNQLPSYIELSQWTPANEHRFSLADETNVVSMVAQACAEKLVQKNGIKKTIDWMREIPPQASGQQIAEQFQNTFKYPLSQIYQETVIP